MAAGNEDDFSMGGLDARQAAQFLAVMDRLEESIKRALSAGKKFGDEVDQSAKSMGFLADKLKQGSSDADSFAQGLGKSSTGMVAVGLATTFLLSKFKSLFDSIKAGLKDLKRYRVEVATLAKTSLVAPGGAQQLEEIRSELRMTRKEFAGFAKELRRGVMEGVASTNQLVQAGKQLRQTFGGDQTENLREFVDLLKAIPTIETDLRFSATLDDRAAAIFALAEEGKIESVVKLEAAGLLGGAGIIQPMALEGTQEDVDMLNTMQSMESRQERIEDVLLNTLPGWSPQIAAIATGVAAAGTGVATLVRGGAAFFALAARSFALNTAAVRGVEGAVWATSGKRAPSVRALRGIKGVLARQLGRGSTLAGARRLRALAPVAKAAGPAAIIAAVSIASQMAGAKLSKFGDTLEKEGKKTKAGLTQLTAAMLKNTSFIGLFTGGWSDAAEGLDNIGTGLSEWSDSVQSATVEGVKKYSWGARQFASLIGNLGSIVGGVGEGMKGLIGGIKGAASGAVRLAREGLEWASTSSKAREEIAKTTRNRIAEIKAQEQVRNTIARTNAILRKRLLVEQRSALGLQRAFKGIENAAKSLATRLADFRGEVAGLRLENLATIGGTATEFSAALGDAASAATERFDILTDALGRWRQEILSDATLTVRDRQNALAKVNKVELEAAQKFARSIGDLVAQFDKIPEVLVANLENRIRQVEFDVAIEAGALEREELFGNLESQLTDGFDALVTVVGSATKDYARAEKAAATLLKRNEAILQSVNETLTRLPDLGAQLRDQLKAVVEFTPEGKIVSIDERGLSEIRTKASAEFKKLSDELGKLDKQLQLEDEISALRSNIFQQEKELKGLKATYSAAVQESREAGQEAIRAGEALEEAEASAKKRAESQSRLDALNKAAAADATARAAFDKKSVEQSKANNDVLAKQAEIAGLRAKRTELLTRVWSDLTKNSDNLNAEAQRYYNNVNQFLGQGKDIANLTAAQQEELFAAYVASNRDARAAKVALKGEADEAGKKLSVYNQLLQVQEANVFRAKQAAAITEEVFKNVQNFGRTLQQVVESIGRSKDAAQARRTLNILEAQRDTFVLFGRVNEQIAAEVNTTTVLVEESLKDYDLSQKTFKKIRDKLKDTSKVYRDAAQGLANTIDAFEGNVGSALKDLESAIGAQEVQAFQNQIAGLKAAAAEISRLRGLGPDISEDQKKALDKAVVGFNKSFSEVSSRVDRLSNEGLRKQLSGSLETVKRAASAAEKPVQVLSAQLTKAGDDAKKAAADIASGIQRALDAQLRFSDDFRRSLDFRQFFDVSELQESLAEVAQESLDFASAGRATTQSILEASAAYDKLIAGLDKRLADVPKEIEKQAAALVRAGKVEEAQQLRTAGKRAQIAKLLTQRAKAELEWKERVVNAAEREFSRRNEIISAEQDTFQQLADFTAEIGGNFDTVLQLQEQAALKEVERLRATEDVLSQLRATLAATTDPARQALLTRQIRLQELAVVKQQVAVQQKFLGVQRSVFDRLAGMAFGGLRTDVGARRRRAAPSRLFGQGFILDRTGRPIGGTAGQARTLGERASGRAVRGGVGVTPFLRGLGFGAAGGRNPMERLTNVSAQQTKATFNNVQASVDLTKAVQDNTAALRGGARRPTSAAALGRRTGAGGAGGGGAGGGTAAGTVNGVVDDVLKILPSPTDAGTVNGVVDDVLKILPGGGRGFATTAGGERRDVGGFIAERRRKEAEAERKLLARINTERRRRGQPALTAVPGRGRRGGAGGAGGPGDRTANVLAASVADETRRRDEAARQRDIRAATVGGTPGVTATVGAAPVTVPGAVPGAEGEGGRPVTQHQLDMQLNGQVVVELSMASGIESWFHATLMKQVTDFDVVSQIATQLESNFNFVLNPDLRGGRAQGTTV